MNRTIKTYLAVVALTTVIAVTGISLTGCVTRNPAPPTVVQIPGPLVTNPPTAPGEPPVVIQLPPILVTNPATPAYIPDPRIGQYSNYVQQALGAASLVPAAQPYVSLGSMALAAIGAILGGISGFVAQKRSTTAALAQASQNSDMLQAVIQGVESATKQPTVTAQSVKSAIQDTATAAGVQTQLHKVVLANT